jgi:hypothetical protein
VEEVEEKVAIVLSLAYARADAFSQAPEDMEMRSAIVLSLVDAEANSDYPGSKRPRHFDLQASLFHFNGLFI